MGVARGCGSWGEEEYQFFSKKNKILADISVTHGDTETRTENSSYIVARRMLKFFFQKGKA